MNFIRQKLIYVSFRWFSQQNSPQPPCFYGFLLEEDHAVTGVLYDMGSVYEGLSQVKNIILSLQGLLAAPLEKDARQSTGEQRASSSRGAHRQYMEKNRELFSEKSR